MPEHSINDSDTKQETPNNFFTVYLKGMTMGMADIVPGVSGATIALLTGIYDRLISAISSVDLKILHIWRQHGFVKGFIEVWKHVDATFLLVLLAGIATSFVTLAGVIRYLLESHPLQIWSLFFGLVLATIFVLLTEIKTWNIVRILLFIIGTIIAVNLSNAPMLNNVSPSLPYLFFSGAIAICAMILPGVSGSFILLLLGSYQAVLTAVHDRDILTLTTVMAGMITGLLIFSKFLKWLLTHYYQSTLAALTGFIAGSLVKIYPWKVKTIIENETANHQQVVNITNVLPWDYPTGAHWGLTLLLMLIGATLVIALSWWGKKQ